jgi:uncharacterized membrane protein
MTVTDFATLLLSIFFLCRGSSEGFMKSLIGPFSIIVTTILSIIYYQMTKNIILSLLIGLIGPLLLNLVLRFLLKIWAKASNRDIKPNYLSSLGGAILTLAWGWVFIILTLILLTAFPSWGKTLTAVHQDVTKSISYIIVRPFKNILFSPSPQKGTTGASQNSSNDAKSLAKDPRFQKILQDPDIQNEINSHDIVKLMRDPKMMALLQQVMDDPALMQKIMNLNNSQTQPPSAKNP